MAVELPLNIKKIFFNYDFAEATKNEILF